MMVREDVSRPDLRDDARGLQGVDPGVTLAYALAYAEKGWPVLPVEPSGKLPWRGNGIDHATTDQAQLREWFTANPDLNVGIYLAGAGLMAVDFDPRNGAKLEWAQALPSTLTAETGGGGLHLIYRVPPGRIPPGSLGPGVDVKHRGYIVAAPSKHSSGQVYTFPGWDPRSGTAPQIAEAPEQLMRAAAQPATTAAIKSDAAQSVTHAQVTELRSALNSIRADDWDTWIRMGMALRCLGDVGRELWLTWSQTSEKYKPSDARKWNTLRPTALHCDYKAVFAEAQRRGWVNPSSAAAQIAAPVATNAPSSEPIQRPSFEVVPLLGHIEHAAPTYVWYTRVPRRVITLWSSHGGFGKTTIAQMLSISCTLGLPLFGSPTEQCNVVYFSAEDEGGLMQHRLHHLCRCMGVDPAQLEDKLFILDATAADDPALFVEVTANGRKIGITTEAYNRLREFMRGRNIGLLIIDNASDVFEANEIERAKVRAFMRSLIKLAREFDMAVVLLAHVDKKSARGEAGGSDSYSGSTAWHNSARSRLVLQKNKAGGLVLVHEKWSLTTQQPDLTLTWPADGIPTLADPGAVTAAHTLVDRSNLKALLRLIHAHAEEGKYVTPSNNSHSAAARVLKGKDGYPSALTSAQVENLLKDAVVDGYLQIDTHKSADGHRAGGKHWALTPAGLELAGLTTAEVGSGK